jgi:hypothetical protein
VVHGDPEPAAAFAERVRRELRIETVLPGYRERITLR